MKNSDFKDHALTATKNWVSQFIVDLNICPFAKKEMENNTINYYLCNAFVEDIEGKKYSSKKMNELAFEEVLSCFSYLEAHSEVETTLVIFPRGLLTFSDYLDFVDLTQMGLEQMGYLGKYQLATFHPEYLFEGEEPASPSHYTNRSPYPTIHIIREESMERVLRVFKEPELIPERNIKLMEEIGNIKLQNKLKNCAD